MNTRVCNKCFVSKRIEDFPIDIHRSGNKTRRSTCKHCRSKYSADWRRKNGRVYPSIVYKQVKKRWDILVRDNFTCQYCGAKAPEFHLEVDHIIPRSRGGKDTTNNLITACWECNRGKRDSLLKKPAPVPKRLNSPINKNNAEPTTKENSGCQNLFKLD